MVEARHYGLALAYALGSVVAGVLAVAVGVMIVRTLT
jgi:fluoride ion exporter CrcB/FEX